MRLLSVHRRPETANASGARFTVVVNHLKSKGSDCNAVGDPDLGDGRGNCSQTRGAAAQALVDWLATSPTGSGDPDFLVQGDLKSYAKEDSIAAILAGSDDVAGTADDFTNLIATFQGPFAYSYVFDGQAGYLQHALSSASLTPQVSGATIWHINADESDVLDYDTTFKPAMTLVSITSNEPDNGLGDGDTANDIVVLDDFTFQLRAERSGTGSGRIYTVTYQATDSCGNTTLASATASVPRSQRRR